MRINPSDKFINNIKKELTLLEDDGFFADGNWTYKTKDILSLYDKLPDDIKKECTDLYPQVLKNVEHVREYLNEDVNHNPELKHFIDSFHGEGAFNKVSSKMGEDLARKGVAARAGVALYYIFFRRQYHLWIMLNISWVYQPLFFSLL